MFNVPDIQANSFSQMNPSQAIAEFVFYVGFVMTMLTQIFLPCYFGNEILVKSELLSLSLYSSNWPEHSKVFRKLVLVYMVMLKQPKKLMVGVLFSLTLDSFLKVIQVMRFPEGTATNTVW